MAYFESFKLKVLVSFNFVVLLVKPGVDSCGELHVEVEDVDCEGHAKEEDGND
jgi:hypothetical protein